MRAKTLSCLLRQILSSKKEIQYVLDISTYPDLTVSNFMGKSTGLKGVNDVTLEADTGRKFTDLSLYRLPSAPSIIKLSCSSFTCNNAKK